jgi:hypothetical protein
MFDFKTYDADTKLKAKSLLAASLIGGGAGIIASVYGTGDSDAVTTGFLGFLLVIAGGHAGGLAGILLRGILGAVRGHGTKNNRASADVVMPALSFGALLGLVLTLIFNDWGAAHWGAGIGAVLGGVCGGLAGESVGIMLRILVTDKEGAMPRRRESGEGRVKLKGVRPPESNEKK